jgi:hypothetical protein
MHEDWADPITAGMELRGFGFWSMIWRTFYFSLGLPTKMAGLIGSVVSSLLATGVLVKHTRTTVWCSIRLDIGSCLHMHMLELSLKYW